MFAYNLYQALLAQWTSATLMVLYDYIPLEKWCMTLPPDIFSAKPCYQFTVFQDGLWLNFTPCNKM